MKAAKWISFGVMLASASWLVLQLVQWLLVLWALRDVLPDATGGMASSVGIIGGADGPTAVFVAGYGMPAWLGLALPVVLLVVSLAAWLWLRAKTRKQA